MLPVAQRIILVIIGMNVFLWVGGFMPAGSSIQTVYSWVPGGLADYNDLNASNLDLSINGTTIRSQGLGSFISQTLDFLENIPLIGGFISLIEIVLGFIFDMVFGFATAFNNMNLPTLISVPLTIILMGIQIMALLDAMLQIISARGGRQA